MRLTLAILFICASAWGQAFTLNDPAWLGQQFTPATGGGGDPYPGYPTNITGYPVYAWYVADDYDATTPQWPDRWTNSLTLTNLAASGTWPAKRASALNSHAAVAPDGTDDYLRCHNFNWAGYTEIAAVLAVTNKAATVGDYAAFFHAVNPASFLEFNWPNKTIRFANTTGNGFSSTNQFIVVGASGAPSGAGPYATVYTNNVQVATSANAVAGYGQLHMFRWNDGSEDFAGQVVEMIFFRTNLTDTVRSNVFGYLTNKYAITL